MTVTKIEEFAKAKYRIEIDQDITFVLYRGELRKYDIREGEELDPLVYEEITEKLLPKRATLRVMNLLKSRPYTEYQLRQKLLRGGYSETAIEAAISYVKSYHYVDDYQYARDYIEYHKESKSKQKLTQTLMAKGLSKNLIQECFEEIVGDQGEDIEKEQILKILRKKNYDPEQWTYEEKQRLMASLYRKGFSSAAIHGALLLDITPNYV